MPCVCGVFFVNVSAVNEIYSRAQVLLIISTVHAK